MYTVAGVTVSEKNEEQSAEPCLVVNALPIRLLGRNAVANGQSVWKLALYSSEAVVLGASQDVCHYKLSAVDPCQERGTHCVDVVSWYDDETNQFLFSADYIRQSLSMVVMGAKLAAGS